MIAGLLLLAAFPTPTPTPSAARPTPVRAVPVAKPLATAGPGGPPLATGLRVESLAGPVVLDTPVPRFSWVVEDPDRGAAQSAYRILVASARELVESGVADVWDSGRVESARSVLVPYGGPSLAGSSVYHWAVEVWDEEGLRSPPSAVASFELGPLAGEWRAEYVWDGTANPRDWCLLRKGFRLDEPVASATLHVTAHDTFTLWVNGRLVGRGPAPADPYQGLLYASFDVGADLVPGENAVAVVAHYHGAHSGAGVGGEPAFLLQGRIELESGAPFELVSDGSWKVQAQTPWSEGAPFRGPAFARATCVEDYDARLEIPGWREAGFDDSGWPSARVVRPRYVLRAQRVPPTETDRLVEPVLLGSAGPGLWFVDFGENLSGWPVLTLRNAPPGRTITVHYSEEAASGRVVRDRNDITDYHDVYTTRGDPVETWEPDTRYNGFRYLEIEGWPDPLDPADVRLRWVHTPLRETGSFRCSSPLLALIRDISLRTQLSCTQGVLVDCPQREQTQYAMDAYVQSLNLLAAFDNTDSLRKWLIDLGASERGNGVMLSRYPTNEVQLIPEWALHWVLGLRLHHLHFGDERLLAESYPTAERLMAALEAYGEPRWGLLEDVPGANQPFPGLDPAPPIRTPLNGFYHGALLAMAEISTVLGREDRARWYEERATAVQRGMNRQLFARTSYVDGLGSQARHELSNVVPIAMGVAQGVRARRALRHVLTDDVASSPVEGFYLLDTLLEQGEADHALALLQDPNRLWGGLVTLGETTTWEAWSPEHSRSHAWSAHPIALFSRHVLGVTPTGPAFSELRVRPAVAGGLTWAEGTVPTVRGPLEVSWHREANGLRLELAVPVGSVAELHVPTMGSRRFRVLESGVRIFENRRPRTAVAGLEYLGRTSAGPIYRVPSGRWSFRVAFAPYETR